MVELTLATGHEIVPDHLRVVSAKLLTVNASYRDLRVHRVLTVDHEGENWRIDCSLFKELLNEENACEVLLVCVRSRCKANDAIGLQTVKPMLHHYIAKDYFSADLTLRVQTDLVLCLECQH